MAQLVQFSLSVYPYGHLHAATRMQVQLAMAQLIVGKKWRKFCKFRVSSEYSHFFAAQLLPFLELVRVSELNEIYFLPSICYTFFIVLMAFFETNFGVN